MPLYFFKIVDAIIKLSSDHLPKEKVIDLKVDTTEVGNSRFELGNLTYDERQHWYVLWGKATAGRKGLPDLTVLTDDERQEFLALYDKANGQTDDAETIITIDNE